MAWWRNESVAVERNRRCENNRNGDLELLGDHPVPTIALRTKAPCIVSRTAPLPGSKLSCAVPSSPTSEQTPLSCIKLPYIEPNYPILHQTPLHRAKLSYLASNSLTSSQTPISCIKLPYIEPNSNQALHESPLHHNKLLYPTANSPTSHETHLRRTKPLPRTKLSYLI